MPRGLSHPCKNQINRIVSDVLVSHGLPLPRRRRGQARIGEVATADPEATSITATGAGCSLCLSALAITAAHDTPTHDFGDIRPASPGLASQCRSVLGHRWAH